MFFTASKRLLLSFLAAVALAIPAFGDVTISGTTTFAAIDGSAQDDDHTVNGTFTVNSNLTVLGTINCNDDGAGTADACSMNFAVGGNLTLASGSAIYAENRKGSGDGGDVAFTVGGNVTVQGPSGTLAGAIVSTTRITGANPSGTDHAGNITLTVGGSTSLAAGSSISAGAVDGQAGTIDITGQGPITAGGNVLAGPSNTIASTKYTGAVMTGGAAQMTGGTIRIRSLTHTEPGLVVTSGAIIATQGETPGTGPVTLEGCNVQIKGLVASVARSGLGARVVVRSGTDLSVDGRDLGGSGSRLGAVRSDATQQSATTFHVDLFAANNITVLGPGGSLFAVYSNGGSTSKDASGTVNVISTRGTVTASGNAFAATGSNSGDQGGTINVSAKGNVTLDGATIKAAGDFSSGDSQRAGGHVNARSYSGAISWQAGVGDVRPVGSASGISAGQQGTIGLTYCTTVSTAGTSFPTNGSPVGTFPTTTQTCSPAAPSLPSGESLPDCNDPPVAANDAYTVAEGGTLNVPAPGVLGNDVDPEGQPITAILVTGPLHASSFALNSDGSFTYVHDGSETTTDSFTYKANDGSLDSNVATVNITITPVNDAPVAVNDAYSVNEDTTLNVAAPGVLANDSDPDGPTATAVLVSGPSNASVFALNADGSFTYKGNTNFNGSDSFTYRRSDSLLLSNVATVNITVVAVNDAPVAVNDAYSTNEDTPLTVSAPGVLGNDTDVDSPSLTAVLVSGPSNALSFTLNANGSFNYTPNPNFNGTDSFTYQANDGSLNSNVATVTITVNAVNDAPVAANDNYSTNEDTNLTVAAPGVLGNDSDVDSPSLTAVLVSGPSNAASFALNPNGSFSYSPNPNFSGTDSFTYQANDGSLNSNIATVTITVNAVNDAPSITAPASASTNEDSTLVFNSISVNDVDAGAGNVTVTLGVTNGTLTLASTAGLTVSGNGTSSVSATGTLANLNVALNGLSYAPNANYNGSDSLAITANDNGNTGAGGPLTDAETVAITVNAVNDAPVNSVPGTQTVAEDTNLVFSTSNGNAITTSDVDAGGNAIQVTLTSTNGTLATGSTLNVTVTGNGTSTVTIVGAISDINAALEGTTFTPNLNFNGSASITMTTNDLGFTGSGGPQTDTDTISINVTAVNDAPVANNDGPYAVTTGGTFTLPAPGVLANDTDVDTPPASLTAVLVTGPANASFFVLNADGSFTYTNNGTSGADSFTYKVNDGSLDSNVATVSLNVTTQPPVAFNDAYVGVGNTELRVGLGAGVTPAAVVTGSVLDNDTDADTPHAALVVSAFDLTSANGGSVTMTPTGNFSYIPAVGFTGVDSFNYTVSDGTQTDTGTVIITITERVWYVNNAGLNGSGRSNTPFNNLGNAQSASAVNDWIYVHTGVGTYSGGIVLKNNQKLVGNGVALVVSGYTLNGAGVRPTIGGNGVSLANGNLVTGLNVASSGFGIAGSLTSGATISQVDVTGGSDGISLTSPSGTITISNVSLVPGGAGLVISGGTATVNASNLSVSTTSGKGIIGTGGTLNVSGASSVTSSAASAIDLSGMTLGATFSSVSSSNDAIGIRLNNTTGSFTVTGSGTISGSGGAISNQTTAGLKATSATNISLSNMTFTNAASTNGDTAANCSNISGGSNLTCNAAIYLASVSGASFTNVTVVGSAQVGINGTSVSNFSLTNSEVRNAGNETDESGIQFQNLSGTSTITGSNIHNNFARQMTVFNTAGSGTLTITGSTFANSTAPNGQQGILWQTSGAANNTLTVNGSTFSSNASTALQADVVNAVALLNVNVGTSTFTSNGNAVVLDASAGTMTFDVHDNPTITNNLATAIVVFKIAGASSTGFIRNNVIGTLGVPNSGAVCGGGCDGIRLTSNGTGTLAATVTGNTVQQVDENGILARALAGSSSMQVNISNNVLRDPAGAGPLRAIQVESGGVAGDTTSVCANIVNNTITGGWLGGIRVRHLTATALFRLPGYAGAIGDTAAVSAFLSANNGGASATATRVSPGGFTGGAACATP
jgi:VCBS repeat-containing protein